MINNRLGMDEYNELMNVLVNAVSAEEVIDMMEGMNPNEGEILLDMVIHRYGFEQTVTIWVAMAVETL